jgi:hypothetical protein
LGDAGREAGLTGVVARLLLVLALAIAGLARLAGVGLFLLLSLPGAVPAWQGHLPARRLRRLPPAFGQSDPHSVPADLEMRGRIKY